MLQNINLYSLKHDIILILLYKSCIIDKSQGGKKYLRTSDHITTPYHVYFLPLAHVLFLTWQAEAYLVYIYSYTTQHIDLDKAGNISADDILPDDAPLRVLFPLVKGIGEIEKASGWIERRTARHGPQERRHPGH